LNIKAKAENKAKRIEEKSSEKVKVEKVELVANQIYTEDSEKKEEVEVKVKEEVKPLIDEKREEKCPGAHLEGKKRELYDLMVEYFGAGNATEYPKFIEAHSSKEIQEVMTLYSENISVYQAQ
jgi:hypothetical protein